MGGEKAAVDGKVADVQQPLAAVAGTTGAAPAGPVTAGANSALAVATDTTTAAVILAAGLADHAAAAKAHEQAAVQQLSSVAADNAQAPS